MKVPRDLIDRITALQSSSFRIKTFEKFMNVSTNSSRSSIHVVTRIPVEDPEPIDMFIDGSEFVQLLASIPRNESKIKFRTSEKKILIESKTKKFMFSSYIPDTIINPSNMINMKVNNERASSSMDPFSIDFSKRKVYKVPNSVTTMERLRKAMSIPGEIYMSNRYVYNVGQSILYYRQIEEIKDLPLIYIEPTAIGQLLKINWSGLKIIPLNDSVIFRDVNNIAVVLNSKNADQLIAKNVNELMKFTRNQEKIYSAKINRRDLIVGLRDASIALNQGTMTFTSLSLSDKIIVRAFANLRAKYAIESRLLPSKSDGNILVQGWPILYTAIGLIESNDIYITAVKSVRDGFYYVEFHDEMRSNGIIAHMADATLNDTHKIISRELEEDNGSDRGSNQES